MLKALKMHQALVSSQLNSLCLMEANQNGIAKLERRSTSRP